MSTDHDLPDATLYIATGCAHCPAVLKGMSELLERGEIGRLQVFNISVHPEIARQEGIRSVPWIRIGPFTLHGSYTPAELRQWVERAGSDQGLRDYLAELIENQRLDEATALARGDAHSLELAVAMLGDLDTPMGVRIGIGAMLEELADSGGLEPALAGLRQLLRAAEPQVRADAAYYLGLSRQAEVRDWLKPLLHDEDREVRQIVAEALE
jgi:hypothetical protein